MFYDSRVSDCAHCDDLSHEIAAAREQLLAAGRDPVEPRTLADDDLERELARWLTATREADAAAGYRAGWHRLARLSAPRMREWEALWWRAQREGNQLRSRMGVLLREIGRLSDSG